MSLSVTIRATNKVFTWTTLMAIIQQFHEVLPGFNLCIWRSKRRFVSKECGGFIVHYFHVNSDFYPLLLLLILKRIRYSVYRVGCDNSVQCFPLIEVMSITYRYAVRSYSSYVLLIICNANFSGLINILLLEWNHFLHPLNCGTVVSEATQRSKLTAPSWAITLRCTLFSVDSRVRAAGSVISRDTRH